MCMHGFEEDCCKRASEARRGVAQGLPASIKYHVHHGVRFSEEVSEHEQAYHDEGAEQQKQAREDGLLLLLTRERASRLRGV
jgi:hypothetical protein